MAVLSVTIDVETVEALEVERELLGFESRGAYVQWIVDNRAALEPESGDVAILARCHQRLRELEAAVADTNTSEPPDTEPAVEPEPWDAGPNDPAMHVETVERAETDGPDRTRRPTTRVDTGSNSVGNTAAGEHGGRRETKSDEAAGKQGARSTTKAAGLTAVNLAPERVTRIREDTLSEDAGSLETVAAERLDELSRRAVAKTRKRLNREVETGLEYTSHTSISASDSSVRPGEDVVDLDSLSVPGRSADLIERRQAVAGRAVALLRDRGSAKRSDFVDALFEQWPAGYETPQGWWRCIKRALDQIDGVTGGSGSRVWRYDRSQTGEVK